MSKYDFDFCKFLNPCKHYLIELKHINSVLVSIITYVVIHKEWGNEIIKKLFDIDSPSLFQWILLTFIFFFFVLIFIDINKITEEKSDKGVKNNINSVEVIYPNKYFL